MWEKLFQNLDFFPEQASTLAPEVDAVYGFAVAVTIFFSILIFTLLLVFMVRFRRKSEAEIPRPMHGSAPLEIFWSIIPFIITMVLFGWGAYVFFDNSRPPTNAMDVHVVGKQWMWKLQHPEGKREINELHVPIGQPVRLIITSEDVIHSFYVPAFRIKRDAVPGRYQTAWFEATKTGSFHLFCAEYCGNEHSRMIGRVVVMEPSEYDEWLQTDQQEPLSVTGERLFAELRCDTCHGPDGGGRAPSLEGLFGSRVAVEAGGQVIADEGYLRESILDPRHRIVLGFRPTMPTFQGQVSEEEVLELISYIKTLGVSRPQPSEQEQQR